MAILAMRHAILHDFLVETRSEAPKFVDARTVIVHGLAVGPTTVDVDFVGSPIVRASVVNQAARSACALLRADVRDANGHTASGSTWVESLAQGSTRAIEVLVPGMFDPVAVRWSATDLGGC